MMYVSKHDHLYEKTIASQSIYEGRIIKVKVDEVLLPNGHTAKREIVKLEPGEEPLACASRELEEETGYQAKHFDHLSSFYTSPGFADELLHVYIATGLTKGESRPDEDEFVDVLELTLEEAHELHRSGEIRDAKTVTALFAWENRVLKARG
jgi:ADP-ribose pyrophosphatase